ncbi:unnamed protein product [Paramecium octaurelia]|uniref:Uncharacterized protein n=1 Tax=Paramecium octaurelia TaxID=43137 RepID=A0A8S1UQN3_PAROT|nr:unnamed protein product [Paramecium octaurelia]
MLWKPLSKRKTQVNRLHIFVIKEVLNKRRDSNISNRCQDNCSQLTIIENYQILKQPRAKTLDHLQDLTLKLFNKLQLTEQNHLKKYIWLVNKLVQAPMLVLDYVQINQHSKLMLIKFTINLLSLLILKSPYFSYTSNDQTSKYYQYLMQSRHNLLLEYIDGKNQILQEDIIQNKLQINSISSLLIEMSKMKTYFIQMIKYTVFQFKKKKDLL